MRYYVVCAKLVRALVYCSFFKEVRLGGLGIEGPTLCRLESVCATILACVTLVRALVYCNFLKEVRLGGLGLTQSQEKSI